MLILTSKDDFEKDFCVYHICLLVKPILLNGNHLIGIGQETYYDISCQSHQPTSADELERFKCKILKYAHEEFNILPGYRISILSINKV